MVASAPPEVLEQVAIQTRYEGYIRRQLAEIRRHRATETLPIPDTFEYDHVEGLTFEARDKLRRLRPATLGQASRIPGVSPADISVLLVHLHRDRVLVNSGSGQGNPASQDDCSTGAGHTLQNSPLAEGCEQDVCAKPVS
jgi:hypothetical protein